MDIPNDFNVNDALQFLVKLGISPGNLGHDKLAKLQQIAAGITDPSKISPEKAQEIINILGLLKPQPKQTKKEKVNRNDKCPCKLREEIQEVLFKSRVK